MDGYKRNSVSIIFYILLEALIFICKISTNKHLNGWELSYFDVSWNCQFLCLFVQICLNIQSNTFNKPDKHIFDELLGHLDVRNTILLHYMETTQTAPGTLIAQPYSATLILKKGALWSWFELLITVWTRSVIWYINWQQMDR